MGTVTELMMKTGVTKLLQSIPNIITVSRMIASVALLFFPPFSAMFVILYIYCGISDMADGFLARRLRCQTRTGSFLDSVADVVFTVCISVKLLPLIKSATYLIIWICIIVIIRIAAFIAGIIRFRKIRVLHTYSNKAAGLIIFILLLPYCVFSWSWCAVAVCLAASVAAVDELYKMLSEKVQKAIAETERKIKEE